MRRWTTIPRQHDPQHSSHSFFHIFRIHNEPLHGISRHAIHLSMVTNYTQTEREERQSTMPLFFSFSFFFPFVFFLLCFSSYELPLEVKTNVCYSFLNPRFSTPLYVLLSLYIFSIWYYACVSSKQHRKRTRRFSQLQIHDNDSLIAEIDIHTYAYVHIRVSFIFIRRVMILFFVFYGCICVVLLY